VVSATAPMTRVEYGDYECPFCWMAYTVVQDLRHRLGDRLRNAFRNFSLIKIHPYAEAAAKTADA